MHKLVSLLSLLLVASILMLGQSRAPVLTGHADSSGTVSSCMRCGYCFTRAAAATQSCCQHEHTSNTPPPCDGTCCVMTTASLLVILPECLRLPVGGQNGVLELPDVIWQSRSDAPPVPPPWS